MLTRYDDASRDWFKINTYGIRPDPLVGVIPLVLDEMLIVFGGFNEDYPNTNVYELDLLTNTWTILGVLNIKMPTGIRKFFANNKRQYAFYSFNSNF